MLSALFVVTILVAGQPPHGFVLKMHRDFSDRAACQQALAENALSAFATARAAVREAFGPDTRIRLDALCKAVGTPI